MSTSESTQSDYRNHRLNEESGNAVKGSVIFSMKKFLWLTSCFVFWLIFGLPVTHVSSVILFMLLTAFVLCFGHSLGMHRLFIHNSYQTFYPLRLFFIHLGVVVGICGPLGMLQTHDIRDWAQRQAHCHSYFSHQQNLLKDAFWQLLCDIRLQHPPQLSIEPSIQQDKWIQWMERYWMWQQLPWACVLFFIGGLEWVAWGVALRIVVSNIGHWLIGYFAHNDGHRHFDIKGACTQGYNIRWTSLLTFGECYHNNHHAFPGSAKLSLVKGEWDIGWWCLLVMKKIGWVWNVKTFQDLPERKELTPIAR